MKRPCQTYHLAGFLFVWLLTLNGRDVLSATSGVVHESCCVDYTHGSTAVSDLHQ